MTDTESRFVSVRACLVGERIDTKGLEQTPPPIAVLPLTIRAGANGYAVLFRYGAIVMFDMSSEEEKQLLASIAHLVNQPYSSDFDEFNAIAIDPNVDDHITSQGVLSVKELNLIRIQLIANILAECTVLNHYESKITSVFDHIEPLAAMLQKEGKCGAHGKTLTSQVGDVFLTMTKMVGRVGIGEKPEILWEHSELERLYARLSEEYELKDRDQALNRKLDLVSRTVETLVSLDQHLHSSRLEWYVIILIVVEVIIALV